MRHYTVRRTGNTDGEVEKDVWADSPANAAEAYCRAWVGYRDTAVTVEVLVPVFGDPAVVAWVAYAVEQVQRVEWVAARVGPAKGSGS